jgi:DNA polymerase III epsilon subunit-like protein
MYRIWTALIATVLLLLAAPAAAQELGDPELDQDLSAPVRLATVRTDSGRVILWRAGLETGYERMLSAVNAGRPSDRRLTPEQFDAANSCRVIYVCETVTRERGRRRLHRTMYHNGANANGSMCGHNRRIHPDVTDPVDYDGFACEGRRMRWLINGVTYRAPWDARPTTSALARTEQASAETFLSTDHPSSEIADRANAFTTSMRALIESPTSPGFVSRDQILETIRLNGRFQSVLRTRLASERATAAVSAPPRPTPPPAAVVPTPTRERTVMRTDPTFHYATLVLALIALLQLLLYARAYVKRPLPVNMDETISPNTYVRFMRWIDTFKEFREKHPHKQAVLEEHHLLNLQHVMTEFQADRSQRLSEVSLLKAKVIEPATEKEIAARIERLTAENARLQDEKRSAEMDRDANRTAHGALKLRLATAEEALTQAKNDSQEHLHRASDAAERAIRMEARAKKAESDLAMQNAVQMSITGPMNEMYAQLWSANNAPDAAPSLIQDALAHLEQLAEAMSVTLTRPTIALAGAYDEDGSIRASRTSFASLGDAALSKRPKNGNGKRAKKRNDETTKVVAAEARSGSTESPHRHTLRAPAAPPAASSVEDEAMPDTPTLIRNMDAILREAGKLPAMPPSDAAPSDPASHDKPDRT